MRLTDNPLTPKLLQCAKAMTKTPLSALIFDTERASMLQWRLDDLWVDASRCKIDTQTWQALLEFAETSEMLQMRDAMLAGQAINVTENRPVEHCALRDPVRFNNAEWQKLAQFVETTRASNVIDDVVNLGIGGSDLGPAMLAQALSPFQQGIRTHFVSNVDPGHLADVLAELDPRRALIVVTSKTFTTAETMANADLAKAWLADAGVSPIQAMIAVSANPSQAVQWGVAAERVFDFANGIGGRYSLWSAVGIAVMLSIGMTHFRQFLIGAHAMDRHYATAPISENIPMLLALIRLWNRNFLQLPTYGIMPYDQRLHRLPAWVQQLEMESNGKSVDRTGQAVDFATSPLIWGEAGTNAQHSFFQYLHQGTDIVPLDILLPRQAVGVPDNSAWQYSQRVLAMNAIAQAEALALGSVNTEEPHRHFSGDRPSVMISWQQSTPCAIGRLLAMYEHITVSSGFLWGINSFDQWGVELGKKTALALLADTERSQFSPAAQMLLAMLDESSCNTGKKL